MSWLQFIDSLAGHLAWPLVVLLLILLLRKQLAALAGRVLELSIGGATVKFGDLLSKGAELIDQAPLPPPPSFVPPPAPIVIPPQPELGTPGTTLPPGASAPATTQDLQKLIEMLLNTLGTQASPTSMPLPTTAPGKYEPWNIVSEWNVLDMLVKELASLLDASTRNGEQILRILYKRDLVSLEAVELYTTLRQARNEVVHGKGTPSESQIAEFVRQANYLQGLLMLAKGQLFAEQSNRTSPVGGTAH